MPISLTITFMLIASSVLSAFVALYLLSVVQVRKKAWGFAGSSLAAEEVVFLFDDRTLVDASDAGRDFLAASTVAASPWGRLCALLSRDFPKLEAQLHNLADLRRLVLCGSGELPVTLLAEWRAGLVRITLTPHENDGQHVSLDRLSYKAMDQELTSLRGSMDHAPLLVWRVDGEGAVGWANRAYLAAAAAHDPEGERHTWPLPILFPASAMEPADLGRTEGWPGPSRRAKLTIAGEKRPRWYEIHEFVEAHGSLNFALPANALVQAEGTLREFVQTLTKTFAHLPTGLAIFDKQRQLALFNPSLIDLTGLGIDFLSCRPTLFSFLDRLREDQRMPEPKNYKLWREQMVALERAASTGQYEEIWSLPNGQTYQITGRPHPDGAIALLFEDISSEISLSRRFQAEIELRQATLDGMDEAIAVFSPGGVQVLYNAAYARLWGTDPQAVMAQMGSAEALGLWSSAGLPGPVWSRLRDFIADPQLQTGWRDHAALADGRVVLCRAAAVQGGSALVGFTLLPQRAAEVSKRRPVPKASRARLLAPIEPEHQESA